VRPSCAQSNTPYPHSLVPNVITMHLLVDVVMASYIRMQSLDIYDVVWNLMSICFLVFILKLNIISWMSTSKFGWLSLKYFKSN
jgi:hypothetical protein